MIPSTNSKKTQALLISVLATIVSAAPLLAAQQITQGIQQNDPAELFEVLSCDATSAVCSPQKPATLLHLPQLDDDLLYHLDLSAGQLMGMLSASAGGWSLKALPRRIPLFATIPTKLWISGGAALGIIAAWVYNKSAPGPAALLEHLHPQDSVPLLPAFHHTPENQQDSTPPPHSPLLLAPARYTEEARHSHPAQEFALTMQQREDGATSLPPDLSPITTYLHALMQQAHHVGVELSYAQTLFFDNIYESDLEMQEQTNHLFHHWTSGVLSISELLWSPQHFPDSHLSQYSYEISTIASALVRLGRRAQKVAHIMKNRPLLAHNHDGLLELGQSAKTLGEQMLQAQEHLSELLEQTTHPAITPLMRSIITQILSPITITLPTRMLSSQNSVLPFTLMELSHLLTNWPESITPLTRQAAQLESHAKTFAWPNNQELSSSAQSQP